MHLNLLTLENDMNCSRLIALVCLALTAQLAHADSCKPDCGRITGIEQYTKEGTGSGVGVVAGGVAGALLGNQLGTGNTRTVATVGGAAGGAYLGNMAEKKVKTKKMTKVSVKMDNGDTRTFDLGGTTQFANGDRVQVQNGKLNRYTSQ
jgi:outer membrane lipoprotein SlyB